MWVSNGSDWLPRGEAVFRIDLKVVYRGVEVHSLTEWRNTPGIGLDDLVRVKSMRWEGLKSTGILDVPVIHRNLSIVKCLKVDHFQ
jgi:hypothetical protein